MTIQEQIENFRAAIKKEEEERDKAEAHATRFRNLQKMEQVLQARIARAQSHLKNVQAQIVRLMNETFDVSDDMTIEAAKETLAHLEAKLGNKKE